MNNEQLLTTKEAAKLLGYKEVSLIIGRCKNNSNKIPYLKIGHNVFYKLSDLEPIIENKRCKTIIGQKLRDIRVNNGLTQQSMGYIIGVSNHTVRAYETGRVKMPHVNKLIKLSQHFSLPLSYFLEGPTNDR